jgi:hypothetical protein
VVEEWGGGERRRAKGHSAFGGVGGLPWGGGGWGASYPFLTHRQKFNAEIGRSRSCPISVDFQPKSSRFFMLMSEAY